MPFLLPSSEGGLGPMSLALMLWINHWKVMDVCAGTAPAAVLDDWKHLFCHLAFLIEYRIDKLDGRIEAPAEGEWKATALELAKSAAVFFCLTSASELTPPAALAATPAGAALLHALAVYGLSLIHI